MNQQMMEVFVEQPLASPGSAYYCYTIRNYYGSYNSFSNQWCTIRTFRAGQNPIWLFGYLCKETYLRQLNVLWAVHDKIKTKYVLMCTLWH